MTKKLNLRQSKFVDEYIITGNATQSAINAGYSERTARQQGQRLLSNVYISQEIQKRSEELFDEKAMSIKEALALSASIARGEPQEGYFYEKDLLTGEVTAKVERYYTPSTEDRQRSLDHIFKISGAFAYRTEEEKEKARLEIEKLKKEIEPDAEQEDKLVAFADQLEEVFKDED